MPTSQVQTNNSARFTKTKVPQALPGCCFLCRGSQDGKRWFVDTNMSVDWDGAVYICNFCLEEMAALAGYMSPEVVEKLNEQIGRLEAKVFALTKKESGLEVAIGGLVAAGITSDSPLVVLDRDGNIREVAGEGTHEGENHLGEGEGTPPEPSDDEGVDELRTDATGNEPFELTL